MCKTRSVIPNQLSTAVISDGILIIANTISLMVEKLAILRGPADLHDTSCNQSGLVVENTITHLESAANAFER